MKAFYSIALLLWIVGISWYVDSHGFECHCSAGTDSKTTEGTHLMSSFDYKTNSYILQTKENFDALRDSLIAEIGDDEMLVIGGSATSIEEKIDSNLGLKRANTMRTIFDGHFDLSRVSIESKPSIDEGALVHFQIKKQGVTTQSDPTKDESTNEPNIPEVKSSAASDADYIIYFKENSSAIIGEKEVMQYIETLAQRLKKSKEKIIVEGFDNSNRSISESLALSKRRTWKIRKAFKDNYVRRHLVDLKNTGQVNIGEEETLEAEAENRRVEIRILKK